MKFMDWIKTELTGEQHMSECPTCGCTIKSHHPSVQAEGEVHLCFDPWHEPTAQQILAREARERGELPSEGGNG